MVGWTDEDMPEILISNTLQKETDTSTGFLGHYSAIGLMSQYITELQFLEASLARFNHMLELYFMKQPMQPQVQQMQLVHSNHNSQTILES